MKTRLLAFVLLLSTFAVKAQYVTIPDANFVTWLNNNGYSQCMQGNQMDTTCPAVMNNTHVVCFGKSIADIYGIQFFDNLDVLNCSFNSISSIVALPNTLTNLNCGFNLLTSLPTLPPGIETLLCDSNYLVSLPSLPNSLTFLGCHENRLTSLPTLPPQLNRLECYENQLTSLPAIPAAMRVLHYAENLITSYAPVPDSLLELYMYDNPVNNLPPLPSQLIRINVNNCGLSSLPALPQNLLLLHCNYNSLQSLPNLPNTLLNLNCHYNQISILPSLPPSLTILGCNNNLLDSLPPLHNGLSNISCSYNNIREFSILPGTLRRLYCDNNLQLTHIPNLPDTLEFFDIRKTAIACLPPLGVVNTFYFSQTSLSCLPNYPIVQVSVPTLGSLPICDEGNANGCNVLSNITGRTYVDENSNCLIDNSERGQPNIKHQLWKGAALLYEIFTGAEGLFSFDVDTGVYKIVIDATGLPFTYGCPNNGVLLDTITLIDSMHFNRNFSLQCNSGFDLAAHSVSALQVFRPANYTNVDIYAGDLANFYDARCTHGVAGMVQVVITGPASYVSPAYGALTPSSVSNNVLTYNIADFGAVNALIDFNIVVQTDTFAQSGDQVCFKVNITPTTGDNNLSNNTLTHCFTTVNSYDPNDKTAYPSGNIDTAQEWLTYRIRFQNTGNAEAQHIYIMDTLESDLDGSTFQLLAYSHQPNVQINENIVRFNFPNINLPDSFSNEPGSHGYVQYKVKLKENLPIGTTIENTAFIYFDFNPPVVTNTATNTITEVQDTTIIGIKPLTKDFAINIYPNPANQQVTVTAAEAGHTIYMYTAQGKLVASQTMGGTAETLNIAELPGGIYYIEVAGKAGKARKKLVKL